MFRHSKRRETQFGACVAAFRGEDPLFTGWIDRVLRGYRDNWAVTRRLAKQTPVTLKLALVGWGLAGFGAGLLLVSLRHVGLPLRYLPFALERSAGNQSDIRPIVFGSDVGLVVNYIKPDKTVAFDFLIGQLKVAMEESRQSMLREEAASWKVVRTSEPGPDGTAVYVFAVDPPPRNVDYRISTVVAEAIRRNPDEFYRRLLDVYAAPQNVIDVAAVWSVRSPEVDRVLVRSKPWR